MPVGRHKKPFSSKQKKEQLQAKREKKRNKDDSSSSSESDNAHEKQDQPMSALAAAVKSEAIKLINYQPIKGDQIRDVNRFNLQFLRDSPEELKRLKKLASKSLEYKKESELEVDIDEVYKPDSPLDMPIRPAWNYELKKEQLEQQERNYFASYLNKIFESYKQDELSYFEMNLETWRQLWRVLEISDIILLIVDIRFPVLHFSPAFYHYCTNTLKKDVILVLNKIDLVPTPVVVAWKHYFLKKFPNLHILLFSSAKQIKHRRHKAKKEDLDEYDEEELVVKALAADIYTAKAHAQLYECVKDIVKNNVDLTSWSHLVEKQLEHKNNPVESSEKMMENLTLTNEDTNIMDKLFNNEVQRKKYEHGFVTIGCCGFPNVGKSSLLNSLNGRKVVSVSRTPGHTKHLQTIFLTKSVRICDCPGLVFPSLVSKPLQILAGLYPIAQLQEPYSAIRYLAERIPVVSILKIKHPSEKETGEFDFSEWSPLDICEGWAIKRGYFTAKASRPDVYRAANELLRMALDGRLCLSLTPKNYTKDKEFWINHQDTKQLNEIVHSVEKFAKDNKHLNVMNEKGYDDEEYSDSETDAYKYSKEFESVDDKEKKDDSDSNESSSKMPTYKNPYLLLDTAEDNE